MYPNIPIHIFLIRGARTSKTFTLKLIIQRLLNNRIKTYHQT
jgi:hypothetical protein